MRDGGFASPNAFSRLTPTRQAVFRDPLALTIFDDEHSEQEEPWVTPGRVESEQTTRMRRDSGPLRR